MNANASGYRFGSQSVSGQGTADANTAEAADASTIFANPAGLTRLDGIQFTGGITAVIPHSKYTDHGSTNFVGKPTGGVTETDDFAPKAVAAPNLYASAKLNDQWAVGLGMFVPYGAKLDYDNNWAGRYALTRIDLKSATFNPTVAFKLNEQHSFGFGIDAEYMKATLGQAVDVPGSIYALSTNPALAANSAALQQAMAMAMIKAGANPATVAATLKGILAAAKDGHATMDGKDWGVGFNLGYMFNYSKDTRFGISYRSSIHHKLKGDAVWDFSQVTTDASVNAILQQSSRKKNSPALVDLRTPETLSVNVFSQVDPKLAVMGDVTFTRHNRLQDLNIQFVGTGEGDEVISQQWNNSIRASLGMNYKLDDAWLLRAGVAVDTSPVPNESKRHAALPDSDRYQLSFGANWKLTTNSSIDLAYTFMHFDEARSTYKNACSPLAPAGTCTGNGETTVGTWKTRMHLLGLAYNYKF